MINIYSYERKKEKNQRQPKRQEGNRKKKEKEKKKPPRRAQTYRDDIRDLDGSLFSLSLMSGH